MTAFDPMRFQGCLPNPAYRAPGLRALALGMKAGEFEEVRRWERRATFIEDQGQTGTCESVSASNVTEPLMREHIADDLFAGDLGLDWRAIHKGAWLSIHPGKTEADYSDQEGLPLGTSLRWMRSVGILPPGAEIAECGESVAETARALECSPVQVGVIVHDGFRPDRVNAEGGFGEITAPVQIPMLSGHAMAVTGMIRGRDGAVMDVLAQSWGLGYGYRGWVQCNHLTLAWSYIDRPRYVILDDNDVRVWQETRERWAPYIVKRSALAPR